MARKRRLVLLALAAPLALLAACTTTPASTGSNTNTNSNSGGGAVAAGGGGANGSAKCPYTFAVITHGDNGNFWSVVYKGAKDAAADYGCKLSEVYGSQQQGQAQPDDNAQNAQIQNAINAKVNGIVVSDHDPAIMNSTLASARAAGIPVVLVNAGCDNTDIAASKAITCVGQPESLAGQEAGQRFKSENASNVLCVVHQSGQNLLDRCNGIAQGLGVGSSCSTGSAPASGPACTELLLSTPNAASNPQQSIGQVTAYLQSHPGINAVMTLNNAIGQALVTAKPAHVKIATFDLSSDVQNDLQASPPTMDFAVDQQQYLQGYLPVSFLYLYNKHEGNSVGGGTTVASGPLLVDSTNIKTVAAAIAAGDD
jgi:simple sugar transport system substrate-binding protein